MNNITSTHYDPNCFLCKAANSNINDLPTYDQPIIESKNFIVVSALGQFIEGYVLIAPRLHFMNMMVIPQNLLKEFFELKAFVSKLLSEEYRKPIFFEHGILSNGDREGCCIDHAHMHGIPANLTILNDISCLFEFERLEFLNYDIDLFYKKLKFSKPYFYIQLANLKQYIFYNNKIPNQLGRKVIAEALGCHNYWDWSQYPFFERAESTFYRLRNKIYFQEAR